MTWETVSRPTSRMARLYTFFNPTPSSPRRTTAAESRRYLVLYRNGVLIPAPSHLRTFAQPSVHRADVNAREGVDVWHVARILRYFSRLSRFSAPFAPLHIRSVVPGRRTLRHYLHRCTQLPRCSAGLERVLDTTVHTAWETSTSECGIHVVHHL